MWQYPLEFFLSAGLSSMTLFPSKNEELALKIAICFLGGGGGGLHLSQYGLVETVSHRSFRGHFILFSHTLGTMQQNSCAACF